MHTEEEEDEKHENNGEGKSDEACWKTQAESNEPLDVEFYDQKK